MESSQRQNEEGPGGEGGGWFGSLCPAVAQLAEIVLCQDANTYMNACI